MRVGLSIMTGSQQNVWNNGLFQNIYHLACLLEGIPFVERVFLLNCGDGGHPAGAEDFADRFPLLAPGDADGLDVAVEMGGALDAQWGRRFRAAGGKVVFHICGQPYAALVESTIFRKQGYFGDPQRCDEVWVLAKDAMFAPMLRTIHRCPVHVTPYLWSPHFLNATIAQAPDGESGFGYRHGALSAGARPAIFEPNISPIKMALIPLLACDVAERRQPGAVAHVHLMNGEHLLSHRSFVEFMRNLDLYRDGKVSIGGRDYFANVMARGANVVVSHQLGCSQNYLYLDALHGGYPLVHNSPLFRDAGYFYEGSDVEAGATALLDAVATHDLNLEFYNTRSKRVIDALAPTARGNADGYARRLIDLTQERAHRWRV